MERSPTPPADPRDDELLDGLRGLLERVDPIPEHARQAARWAIEWRTIDAELAELVHDSTLDEPALAIRSHSGPRALTFEAADLTIELETEAEPATNGNTLRIVGQLIPAQPAQIAMTNRDEVVLSRADEHGRFSARGLSRGPLRLRCRLDGNRLVETASLTI